MAERAGRLKVRWTKGMREGFLDHLAATGNVKRSALEVGVDPRSVYNLRRRDPKFSDGWNEALALGYQMIETRLIGHALEGRGHGDKIADDGLPPVDPIFAMSMLAQHYSVLAGNPRKNGTRLKRATEEETNAALMKKLDAVEKRMRAADKQ
jgi:hypothetical protein